MARVVGELYFEQDFHLIVRERVLYQRLPIVLDWYGYEAWQKNEKLYWYDPQPHPNEPSLQSSHPHHQHIPPNIKHNRIPAPQMSFTKPNLPILIEEMKKRIRG